MSPAASFLFDTGDLTEELPECSAQEFYALTAKLLFLCKRVRPGIQTVVAFLTTRVMDPTVHNRKKSTRVVKYLRHTNHLHLVLSVNSTGILKWWIDGAFVVHPDMPSHIGDILSME